MASRKIQTYQNKAKNLYSLLFILDAGILWYTSILWCTMTWTLNANSLKQNIIVIKVIGGSMFFLAATSVGWIGDFPYRKVAAKNIFHLVSIVVQNLDEIDAGVSITWNFQCFARLAWKRLFTSPKLGFSRDFTSKMGSNVNETPKRHICGS